MRLSTSQRKKWLSRAIVVATFVAVILLASHPELRLLVPFIDAAGIDVFLLLVGAQAWAFARPVLVKIYRMMILPVVQRSYRLLIFLLGISGPFTAAVLSARFPQLNETRSG